MVSASSISPSAWPSATPASNYSCPTLYAHKPYARVLMPLFYSVVFVVGLSGNALALHVIRPNRKKMNSTTLYSLNLVISDILFTLSVPFRLVYYAMGFDWPMGEALCKVSGLVFYLNTYAGVNFMTCLSVDRFIAVVLPQRLGRFRRVENVRYICLGIWLLVLAQTLPLLNMKMTHKEDDGHITCMEYPSFEAVNHIAVILIGAVFLGYVIPVVTLLLCYSVLCSKLRLSARNNRLLDKSGRSRKAIGVICCVSLVFVLCYSPYHVDLLQYMARKLLQDPPPGCAELTAFQVSLHVTVCLMNLNPCLDPFIYFFACRGYKKKVMQLLRRHASASFSSVGRTSVEGSSRDAAADCKVPLNAIRRSAYEDAVRESERDAARESEGDAARESERDAARESEGDAARESEGDAARESEGDAARESEGDTARESEGDAARESEGDAEGERDPTTVDDRLS